MPPPEYEPSIRIREPSEWGCFTPECLKREREIHLAFLEYWRDRAPNMIPRASTQLGHIERALRQG